ncbi:MAG: EAL domain-containing protein [Proteobacteria bacterium]|nr:EAL domain-containing protein [Pseudomonadota bacterium]
MADNPRSNEMLGWLRNQHAPATYLLLFVVGVGGILLSVLLGRLDSERQASDARARATAELARISAMLEGQVRSTFGTAEGISHMLSIDGDISDAHFYGMARMAIASASHIRSIALVPDDVIQRIYPRANNEKALGTNLRTIPEQYAAIQRARNSRHALLAGPLNLIQGGVGLIYRQPIFTHPLRAAPRYWGTMSIVTDLENLIRASGISNDASLRLLLRGKDGLGSDGEVIWGDTAVLSEHPVSLTVMVPGGTWQLSAIPRTGWPSHAPAESPLFLISIANTALVLFFIAQLMRRNTLIRQRNLRLSQEIAEREEAESSLAQSEVRFRTLFEHSPDATWVIDGNGRFIESNDAALALFGFSDRAQFQGMTPMQLSPERQADGSSSPEKVREILDITLRAGLHRFEWLHRRSDGHCFPAEVTLCVIPLSDGPMIYAVARDISERKATEEALGLQQALLQTVVDHAPSLIYVFDKDGNLQWSNRCFETAMGASLDTMRGMPREHFQPADLARLQRTNDLAVLAEGQAMRFEEQLDDHGQQRTYLTTKCPLPGADGQPQAILAISTDITEIKQTTEQLRLAGVVIANTADAVMITDARSTILSVNRAFTDITGYSAEEAIGQTPRLLRSDHQPPEFYRAMWETLRDTGGWRGEIWNRRKNGALYPEWLTINAVNDDAGHHVNYVAVFSDISAIKHSQAELERLAHYDPLTDLPNRTLFHHQLQHDLDRAVRYERQLAVLILDLDGFKTVNDSLGHPVGDCLLQQAAERFKRCLRVEDTVSRLGGDEFAVILGDLGQDTDAVAIVKKILQALQEPFDLDGHAALITASIGIAIAPTDGRTPEELVRNADTAMYGAKEGGRNSYRFYQAEMTRRAQDRLTRERALRRALEEKEFELWYQPKLNLESGRISGAEALLRWRDPERGMVSPAEFIPLAERTALIIPIGELVLDTVCAQIRLWRKTGLETGRIAINVAALQIERSDYVDTLASALARHGLPPEVLEVEVTESLIMENPEHARQVIHAIQDLGVTTAVDDFGTGYSSLAYLKVLPINNLKVDRAFVSDLPHDENDVAITRAIVGLGQTLGFEITAEGIETVEQLEFLRSIGCNHGQGYLFGKPMPVAEFEDWIIRGQHGEGI